jgi:hypothetical protein
MSFLCRLDSVKVVRCISLFLAFAAFSSAVAAQHRLVIGGAKSALVQPPPSPRVMRHRSVSLDLPAVANAAADPKPYLEIAFFEDAVYRVVLKGSERTYSGGTAYHGHAVADPLTSVVIVNNTGTVSVIFAGGGRRFSIQGSAEYGYVAREHVDRDLPDHGPGIKPPVPGVFEVPGALQPKSSPEYTPPPVTARDDGSTIDVAIVYTPAARVLNTSVASMNANIDAQLTYTNLIYTNSNVVQQLRLVYRGEIPYTETDMDTDLSRLAHTSDGFMDEAPLLRDLYAADFVSLWGDYQSSGFCGLGFLMTTEASTFAANAYNVLSSPDCTGAGSATFAHELGHNMGLRHDNFEDTTAITRVTPEAGGALTDITYAHGYIDLVNRFRTVMSYNNQCAAQVPSFNCTRIAYFSNPSVSFNNNASYASAVLAPTGDAATAHERQALNDTRDTTANFRTALTPFPPVGAGTLTFMPTSANVAEGAGSVVLTVGRHLASTGAIGVTYTTVAGTATAGADFTTTSGTLNWADGETANKPITVPILQDAVLEGNETFTVTLSAPTGGATIAAAGGTATVNITDDEPDTFPVGSVLPTGFTSPNNPNANSPDTTWSVDASIGYLSTSSLRSAQVYSLDGDFTNFANSDIEYTGTFAAGNVSFYYRLSSYHNGLSGFEFQVDGVAVFSNNVGGEVDWTLVTRPITAGTHTLRWRFKNRLPFACAGAIPAAPGGSSCADRAWIDLVTLPAASGGPFALTVTLAGSGAGTVVSAPAGISCAGDCTESYASGTAVTLTATPADGSTFAGWSGGGCSGTGQCTVTMNAAAAVTATFDSTANPPRLANISTRMQVLTGDNVLIGGLIIGGSTPKTVVVRARGPSLAAAGVPNVLANPVLNLYSGQTVIASNDDWQTAANAATLQASGFAPANAQEAAIYMTLNPGAYTAIVQGAGGATGVGIVEVFEVDALTTPLINIATRGQVLTADNVMIGGFIIQGSGPQTVVVRARSPSLAAAGVPNVLANPTLSLYSGQTVIASNDDFGAATNAAQLVASGFAPSDALESAILITLNPGAYTAIVSGVGGTIGVGIVEVFAVP